MGFLPSVIALMKSHQICHDIDTLWSMIIVLHEDRVLLHYDQMTYGLTLQFEVTKKPCKD